jgi:molybdopterin-guanine dinucleotide biosynthesis protein A
MKNKGIRRDVTGLILAGGKSRRFGSDKAVYPVEGRPMIERVHEAVASVVSPVLISVGEEGRSYGLPARTVVDVFPGAGPLAGIHAGLAAAETPWLLVVAVDMPFVSADALTLLLDAIGEDSRPVVASSAEGRIQPLLACYPVAAAPIAEMLLKKGRYAVFEFLDALEPARLVPVPDIPLRNVNYRVDLD